MSEQELRFREVLLMVVRESGLPPDRDIDIMAQALCGMCRAAGISPTIAVAFAAARMQQEASA